MPRRDAWTYSFATAGDHVLPLRYSRRMMNASFNRRYERPRSRSRFAPHATTSRPCFGGSGRAAVAERSGDRSLEGTGERPSSEPNRGIRWRETIRSSVGRRRQDRAQLARRALDEREHETETRAPHSAISGDYCCETFRVSADWILGLARSPHHQIDVGVPGAVALVDYISLLYGLQPPTNLAERNPDYAEQQKQARRVFAESMAAAREELDIARVSKEAEQIPERRAALRARKRSP